jgi:hypothetical protein
MTAPEVSFSDFSSTRVEPDATTNPMTEEDLHLIARVIPDLERLDYPSSTRSSSVERHQLEEDLTPN